MAASLSLSAQQIQSEFSDLVIEVVGDSSRPFSRTASPEQGSAGALIFIGNERARRVALAGLDTGRAIAQIWAVTPAMRTACEAAERTLIVTTNLELLMAQIITRYFLSSPQISIPRLPTASTESTSRTDRIHPRATVAETAKIHETATICAGAVVGERVQIGARAIIGANSVIEDDCSIGVDTVVHPLVVVCNKTMIGDRCEIHSQSVVGKEGFGYAYDAKGKSVRIPHQGRVVIEDDVHIGSCTTIDRATFDETRIGSGGKFDNQMHIAHNVTIGAHAIVTGGFMVAGSTHIGSRFLAGGRSTVSGHLELGDGVQISGLSAVTKSIAKAGKYGGHPLLPLQDHLKMKAALVHLAQMRRQLNSVLQKLGISDDDAAAEPQA